MKSIAMILLVLLSTAIGCGHREPASTRASRQLRQWVPVGTPLESARLIMEQHHFTCSVDSYTNKQGMIRSGAEDPNAVYWDTGIWVNGRAVRITNITNLTCTRTNCSAVFTFMNGADFGGLRVMTVGPPSL